MANKKSAKQDILINNRNRIRNVHYKTMLKTSHKKALAAIESNDENVLLIVQNALKTYDKVAAKGIIHKKTAARKKSRLTKKFNLTQQS